MIYKRLSLLSYGVILSFFLTAAAFFLSCLDWARSISLSPLIIAILLGLLWANVFPNLLPSFLNAGLVFSQKKLLKLGIILYGFRLTFIDVSQAGVPALVTDVLVIVTILSVGLFLGKKVFGLNTPLSVLIATGSAICGAAAVLASEEVVKAKKHEVTIAVATVVLFGSLSLFISPLLLKALSAQPYSCALALGSTVHEVAQVLASASFFSQEVSSLALVIKLTRVLMLLPVLVFFTFLFNSRSSASSFSWSNIPYFACGFFLVILLNSLVSFPTAFLSFTKKIDSFLLCMAMSALSLQTSFKKLAQVGIKPFLLAGLLASVLYFFLVVIALV